MNYFEYDTFSGVVYLDRVVIIPEGVLLSCYFSNFNSIPLLIASIEFCTSSLRSRF